MDMIVYCRCSSVRASDLEAIGRQGLTPWSDASREEAVLREIRKTEQREREEREEEVAERRTEQEIMRGIVDDEVDEYDVDE